MQTEAIPTNWTNKADFANDVYNAFVRIGLPPQAAELFTAHSALSTGWGKSTFNWNLAGLKLRSGYEDTYDWHYALGSEDPDGMAAKKQMQWRSFSTIDEGVQALWNNLQNSRYDSARALMMAGDTEYFAEVGRNGWYNAYPEQMKSEMTSNLNYIRSVLGSGGTVEAGTGGLGLVLLVGVGVWYLLKYFKK
jgi:hypothetical protein